MIISFLFFLRQVICGCQRYLTVYMDDIDKLLFYYLLHVPGVPLSTPAVWKDIFRDNVNLKRNWANGRCKVTDMAGHTHK